MIHLSEAATVQRLLSVSAQILYFLERSLGMHAPPWQFILDDFQAYTLSLNSSISGPLTFANNFTISFDQSFYQSHDSATLRLAFIDYNIFLAITPSESRTAAPIAQITLE